MELLKLDTVTSWKQGLFAARERQRKCAANLSQRLFLAVLPLIALIFLTSGCGSSRPAVTVTITGVSSSPALQPNSNARITISGLNAAVDLSVTSITFTPATGGTGTQVSPSAQTSLSGSNVTLTFKVPALAVSGATQFSVSIDGQTVQQQGFRSSAPFSVEVDPATTLISVTPSAGSAGQSLTVALVASNSNFVQGTTQASFGAGIAVNGAGEGMPGNITVTNATTATASLVIDPAAATGARDVIVTTGDQTATLASGFTVNANLLPLVVSAGGPYTGYTGSSVAFNGGGSSDPNGGTLSYAWNFGDGGTGTGATPSHTFARAGTYTVTLTLSDTNGLTGSATTTATITALSPPVAVPGGPYTGTVNQPIVFNGSASSDPNQSTLTYAWTFGDGGTATGATPSHTYTTAGSYQATLTVTDALAQSASATATVTVSPAAQAPRAVPGGPYTGVAEQLISFNGSGSTDPNSLPLTYAWDFGDGTVGVAVSPQHAYAAAGTYTVKLTVSDSTGLSNTQATTATVTAAAAGTPTANAGGPYTGIAGTAIAFDALSSTDPNGETLTYAWSFGDGGTATAATASYTYASAGTYNVTLTVTNTSNQSASASTTATITAAATQLTAVENGPYTGNVSQVMSFDGSSSTAPNGDTLTYNWNFGDNGMASGAQVTHAYAAAGTYTVTLTVVDGANQASTTAAATITQPPGVQITSPTQGALFNTGSVPVTGTVGTGVQSVTVNGTAANLSGTSFTASVPVREGMNVLTAVATDSTGNTGTASTSVTIDLTPPIVSVLQPTNTSTVTTQQITVAGMVTDQVTGTVNANNVTVTVNGQAAAVANRSFALNGLVLVPGTNTLTVVATDAAGNTAQSVAHVSYASVAAQQHVVILSGNLQTGTINSVLPQPLVVQLVSATGSPIPSRAVTFTVTASDGVVESLPQQGQTLSLMTDTTGKASVLFQLGSRAGLGINQVAVTSPGFLGSAVFTETTTVSAPAFIHEFLGNNQRGILGQPLAEAFQTIVQDSGGNPIANIPVTFTVTGGDGTLNGQQTTYTVSTDTDGRAIATLTLGQQEGINNNTVSADFAGDQNSAVEFYASGYASGNPSATSVTGVVMDNGGNPVPNATIRLQNTNLSTTTDANGHFVISGAPVGTVTLLADGSTTTLGETLPSLTFVMQDLPGQNNTLNMPIYLPIVDTQSAQTVGGDQPVTLTLKNMPGASVTIAPNSVTFPDGTHVGQMTLSQVKSDLVPMPPPNGIPPAFAWTLQPAGTRFSVPAAITIPNTDGLPPGQVQEFFQYDHDLEQFVSVGTLRVSPDGSVLNSDPGFGITKAGWSSPGSNPPPGVCAQTCDDGNPCTKDSMNSNCQCDHQKLNSGGCGNNNAGRDSCLLPGQCVNGQCNGGKVATGKPCNSGKKCETKDVCLKNGVCKGTPVPDKTSVDSTALGDQIFVNWQSVTGFVQNGLNAKGPGGFKFQYGFQPAISIKQRCCETANGAYKDLDSGTVTVQVTLTSPDAVYGVNFLGIELGPYVNAFVQGNFPLSISYNGCSSPSSAVCISGGGGIQVGINAGIKGEISNPAPPYQTLAELNGYAQVSTYANYWADCQAQHVQFGLNAVTLNLAVTYPNGNSFTKQLEVLPAIPAGGFAVANPPPSD